MAIDSDALNYPYIRVRSADWLKRTLLIFPHVARMTPTVNAPLDDPEISEFCYTAGRRGALLRSVDLWTEHVRLAQQELIRALDALFASSDVRVLERFRKRDPETQDRGQTAKHLTVWERRLSGGPSFQIHRYKLLDGLVGYLVGKGLAWEPNAKYSDGSEYLEMNPRLGEAIMATLATACAESEGLQVVTEFPKLHGRLIGTPRDAILQACLADDCTVAGVEGHRHAWTAHDRARTGVGRARYRVRATQGNKLSLQTCIDGCSARPLSEQN